MFYTNFIQGQAVTAAAGADVPDIRFLNEFYDIPYEFYIEGRLVITKKLEDADGNAVDSSETFYAGVFEDPEFTTLCDRVSANVVALQLNGASEASDTVRMVLSDTETVNLYVTEVDADGTPVLQDPDFAYEVTITGSSASLNAANTTAETTIINRQPPKETEPETKPGGVSRIETEPETPSETNPQTEPETPSETNLQTEPETPSETSLQTEPETPSETNLQTEPETPSETNPQTEPQTTSQTQPQTSTQTEKQTQSSVKTGDDTPIVLYITLLAAAAVILAASMVLVRRRHRRS
jgi:hypothetical protein